MPREYGGQVRYDTEGFLTGLDPSTGQWARLYGNTPRADIGGEALSGGQMNPGGSGPAAPTTPYSFDPTEYSPDPIRGQGQETKTFVDKAIPIAAIAMGAGGLGYGALGALGAGAAGSGQTLGGGLTPGVGAADYLGVASSGAGGTGGGFLGGGLTHGIGAGEFLGMGAPAAGYSALGGGIGAGANALGALGAGSYPAASVTFTDPAGAGITTPSSNATPLGSGLNAQQGTQLGTQSATTAGSGTPAAGGSFTDSLLAQMKNNALALGLMTAGTAASLAAGKPQIPNEAALQGLSAESQAVAQQLIAQYKSGSLTPGQQASLDQLSQNTKNQLKQYFASIGQSNSTAATQALAQVDQTAAAMKQQILDNALQTGLQAVGVAQGPLNTVAQYQLAQDQQLKQAFGNFASGVGQLFGRNAGSTGAQQQPKSTAPTPVVQSTQNPIPVG